MIQAILPIPGYFEQTSLPGLPEISLRQRPLLFLLGEELPESPRPSYIPGQMVLGGPEQPELAELPLSAVQLSLLPDPPLWELDPGPPPAVLRGGRLSRRRARSGITAGQQGLF